ncbi:MAG TPA: 2-oxoacid:acceptor oxidoreductase family protein, partial [Dehalococcoidia bacterium]|nr:2-oxoacid:acceptor oxidoreductase family protein [Dehalococcoidia bacterium]
TERVAAGLHPKGTIIVNSTLSPQAMRRRLGLDFGTVGTVDATGIALAEGSRVNTAMLGAAVRATAFLDSQIVEDALRETFQNRYPHLVDANLRTFRRGSKDLRLDLAPAASNGVPSAPARSGPAYGYLNAPLGGLIPNPGNTILKDLTASRSGFVPQFEAEKCVHCALCDLVCPDFCLVWEQEGNFFRLRGIDYRYCKGCMKCVDVCPTDALVEVREEPGYAERHSVPLFPNVVARKGRSDNDDAS